MHLMKVGIDHGINISFRDGNAIQPCLTGGGVPPSVTEFPSNPDPNGVEQEQTRMWFDPFEVETVGQTLTAGVSDETRRRLSIVRPLQGLPRRNLYIIKVRCIQKLFGMLWFAC